jgi:hypothetical protein
MPGGDSLLWLELHYNTISLYLFAHSIILYFKFNKKKAVINQMAEKFVIVHYFRITDYIDPMLFPKKSQSRFQ